MLVQGVKQVLLNHLRQDKCIAVGPYVVQHIKDGADLHWGKLYVTVNIERL